MCHAWPAAPLCGRCIAQFGRIQARCECCALPLAGGIAVCAIGTVLPFTGAVWITVRLVLAVALGVLFLLLVRRIFTR